MPVILTNVKWSQWFQLFVSKLETRLIQLSCTKWSGILISIVNNLLTVSVKLVVSCEPSSTQWQCRLRTEAFPWVCGSYFLCQGESTAAGLHVQRRNSGGVYRIWIRYVLFCLCQLLYKYFNSWNSYLLLASLISGISIGRMYHSPVFLVLVLTRAFVLFSLNSMIMPYLIQLNFFGSFTIT